MRIKRFMSLFIGALCTVGLGAAVALASNAGDDAWGTGQDNQSWSASSTSFTFAGNGLNNNCTNDNASGTSTGAGTNTGTGNNPDAGLINMNTPTFASCNFTVTTNNTNGSWQIAFWSDAQPTGCPGGGGSDESSTTIKDCVEIKIPRAGATINFGLCTVTIAPAAAASVYGSVTENPGTPPSGKDTITFTNQSVPVSGCGATTGTLNGSYTLNAVNGSYLDEFSGADDGAAGSDAN
jgi:hypothetical protein